MFARLLALSLLAAAAAGQSGRTMAITSPPQLGGTLGITVTHPVAAAGHYYEALFSYPTPAVVDLGLPFVVGEMRVDLATFNTFLSGFFGAGGTTLISVPVPNTTTLLGGGFDLQTIDVDLAGPTLYLADNDVEIRPYVGICKVHIAVASNQSPVSGDNDIQTVDDAHIGAPVSQGVVAFSYQSIQHRGQEGFVAGYGGSFTGIAHNSDIDCWDGDGVAKRTANPSYQVVSLPGGHDIALVRHMANKRMFSVLSFNRATGAATLVPGSTVTDTGPLNEPVPNLLPRVAFASDGALGAVLVRDTNPAVADRVLVFAPDGASPAIDVTPTTPPSTTFFDGSAFFTDDFFVVAGDGGWYWTSASAPAVLTALTVPNTTASNAANAYVYPFSWRVSRDGAVAWFPIGSGATPRSEMDIVKLVDNAGVPQVTNETQFATATALAEFGYSGVTPEAALDSSFGLKAATSPDGSKLAFLGMGASPGVYVADGTADPAPLIVGGASFYSELTFLNATTILFFAGPSPTQQNLYAHDLVTNTTTVLTGTGDIRTRGQFWSRNRDWWYFVRSNASGTVNNIVGVDATAAAPALKDITGAEFSTGSAPALQTGGLNTTTDPWPALEFQIRRVPLSDWVVFTGRRAVSGAPYEDANVFRFDIEHGGEAVELTANRSTGTQGQVLHIDSLVVAADPQYVAWAERVGISRSNSEDVYVVPLLGGLVRRMSVPNPSGQSVVDGSIRFTCEPTTGLVWALGTGPFAVPDTSTVVEWSALGGPHTPTALTAPVPGAQVLQVLGTSQ
ncbi:MAG: hypothetical protein R3F56_09930 [Planctomycetota bacterium]